MNVLSPRPASSLTFLVVVLVSLLPWPAVVSAASPVVASVSPGAASPGDVVVLDGSALNGPADEYFAWVQTPDGGFVLDAPANAGAGLAVTVGPVAAATTGSVEVWRGYGHRVAPQTLLWDGRLISAVDTRVFVQQSASSAGPPLTALSTSPWTLSGSALSGLDIDFQPLYPDPLEGAGQSIRVDAAIKTRGSKNGDAGAQTGSGSGDVWFEIGPHKATGGSGPAWAFQLRVELDAPYLDDGGVAGSARLAAAFAELLTRQLGSLGLVATASGSVLTLDAVGGIEGGFVTLAVEAP